jgi:hypothetical protein
MPYVLTDKGRDLIKTKIIDGKLYALCDRRPDGTELWLYMPPQQIDSCVHCGYQGVALDRHHIHGRKNSDETIFLCSNCHRELHAGEWSYDG